MNTTGSFAIRYDGLFKPLCTVMGIGPGLSKVTVGPDDVRVHMGWGFQARISRATIRTVAPHTGPLGGVGVHGWRGRYLVNGSLKGVVRIEMAQSAANKARCTGLPVKLTTLLISLEDPEGFQAALGF
jgi:hypothetical protein